MRRDVKERFFSYGYSKENSSVLFCSVKSALPNVFSCTAFKKHVAYLLDQNENKVKSSSMFMFIPSTLDRKEEFIQWKDHVHLDTIDLTIDDLVEVSGIAKINPVTLNSDRLKGKRM